MPKISGCDLRQSQISGGLQIIQQYGSFMLKTNFKCIFLNPINVSYFGPANLKKQLSLL